MSDLADKITSTVYARIGLPVIAWLGGAFYVANQPGYGFWDGLVWTWYAGRYLAANFAMLHY